MGVVDPDVVAEGDTVGMSVPLLVAEAVGVVDSWGKAEGSRVGLGGRMVLVGTAVLAWGAD